MSKASDLRWQLAGDDPQGALFQEVERHVGRGEFRGLEFLHVRARRIINEVPEASRVPFRYTINAYRGCSHACSYCVGADTPILLAEGRVRSIAALHVGDMVVGTERVGRYRRYVATPVLAHWSTLKPAFRVTLEDGATLVASGDHRFLTERGWKHVTGSEPGRDRRSYLTPLNSLLGIGPVPRGPVENAEYEQGYLCGMVRGARRVVSVEPLGVEMPMYDITTGTGDFIANGVVSHNCFARPTHEYLGLNAGEDFERRIVVKVNAVERVRAELAPGRWGGDHIAMGTNTDPYQRCEGKYRLTQGIVGELSEAENPFSILTKSTLILRDLDLLVEAARRTQVRANFSIGTLDDDVWRMSEPGTPHPLRRVDAVARLNEAGVPCGVLVAPVLPGLSDAPEQLAAVVKACVDAGAVSITPLLLHLRPGVREHYLGWLSGRRPDLVDRHARLYPRSYAPGKVQDQLAELVRGLVAKHGGRSVAPRETRAVAAEARRRPVTKPDQLQLGV